MKLGIYQHYKGEYYLVIGVARHTETEERLVVYVPLYVREGPRMACRPYDEFNGSVGIDREITPDHPAWKADWVVGQFCVVPRFDYVGEEIEQ